MKNTIKFLLAITVLTFFGMNTHAQYNTCAAQNSISEDVVDMSGKKVYDKKGRVKQKEVRGDSWGNAAGNQYDLAVDGAFSGQTVAVLHFYTGEGFDFKLPEAALKEKGFGVYRWLNGPPSPEVLRKALKESCQLWIISSSSRLLNEKHLEVIKEFFDSGKGVYIWGDNQPYYADANYVSEALIGVSMQGNIMGDKTVGLQKNKKEAGLAKNHLITTGLQHVYEGITIATIGNHQDLTPIIYGSANNLVCAAYEKDGKRLLFDGGFTRLFLKWESAGTGRYVKNAAAWLVNYERFGDLVVKN